MIITNDTNLPKPFLRAMKAGEREPTLLLSPSKMTDSVRQVILNERHYKEATKDASSMIWSMFGTALHDLAAKHSGEALAEHFMEAMIEVDGEQVPFRGTADLFEDELLTDFKVTSVWKIVYKEFNDWSLQINSYRYLLESEGFFVRDMEVKALLRDWQKSKALQGGDYPQKPVVTIPFTKVDIVPYFVNKVRAIKAFTDTPDDLLPPCSDEERWRKASKWKVMVKGQKRAVKVCDSFADAESYMTYHNKNGMGVFEFPAKSNKCDGYCDAAAFCNQYKEELDEQERIAERNADLKL